YLPGFDEMTLHCRYISLVVIIMVLAGCGHSPQPTNWEDEIIYFALLDRFHNGDPANDAGNSPASHVAYDGTNPEALKTYQGGDLRGMIRKLGYLDSLGVTALWLTPFFDNSDSDFVGWWPYHGYHPVDFYAVDEHFGTEADLIELVEKAHERGMKVIFDMVFNQTAADHPWVTDSNKQDWYHRNGAGDFYHIDDWFDQEQIEQGALHGMPDLNQENPDVEEYLIHMAEYWIEKTGCDGFRLDAVKHIEKSFWQDFNQAMHHSAENDFFLLGEVFWGEVERMTPYLNLSFDALFDIPGYYTIKNTFAQGGSMADLSRFRQRSAEKYSGYPMVTLLDNHDVARFTVGIEDHADAKLKLALTWLLTTPGIPVLYYGTEIGLEGGPLNHPITGEPQDYVNRRMMPETFTTDQQQMFNEVQRLIRLRRDHPALRKGEFVELYKDWGVYAYLQSYGAEQFLVILNNAATTELINIPKSTPRYTIRTLEKPIHGAVEVSMKSDSIRFALEPFSAGVWPVRVKLKTKDPWAMFTDRLTGDYHRYQFKYTGDIQPNQWSIAGDFTNWQPRQFPITSHEDTLIMTVPLRKGTYRYKFVLHGQEWVTDSLAPDWEIDPYGGLNSLVRIR
ncbi:MAG: hypothetical protein K9N34_08325, partial [Candidatus Marinimicrobia bacterium]|nr:hypothetical protein [Candidatus Neomarinimicrobiota bacterium]